ncbi:MAG: IspD/TarI family cytidylyltransferase, partial [Solirubrobacterales bacterium]
AGGPKAFVPVGGRPLIEWSLEAFGRAQRVGPVIVALPPGHDLELGGQVSIVPGGEHRSQSVAAALREVRTELVAVHDAARPLVTAELIDSLVEALASRDDVAGVIAAARITDTVKRVTESSAPAGEEGRAAPEIEETVSRDRLWAAQTPQVFRTEALREAIAAAPGRLATATDEALLVEEAGGTILIGESTSENLKVTTPLDLRVADLLLRERT